MWFLWFLEVSRDLWKQRTGWTRGETRSGGGHSPFLYLPLYPLLPFTQVSVCVPTEETLSHQFIIDSYVINLVVLSAENVSNHQRSSCKIMRMWGRKGKII